MAVISSAEGTRARHEWRPFRGEKFLSSSECAVIRSAMDEGRSDAAEVLGEEIGIEATVRCALEVDVNGTVLEWVGQRIDGCRPLLESFYATPLEEREGASFVRYRSGGFYKPHRDSGLLPSWPGAARRRIAVVAFLNGARSDGQAGDFSGGSLWLYPEEAGAAPIRIVPRTGLLVAFPASMLHEVEAVRDGTRDAIVDWFY